MVFEGQEVIFKEIIQIVEQKENEMKKIKRIKKKEQYCGRFGTQGIKQKKKKSLNTAQ